MIVTLVEMKAYLNELTTDYDVFLTQQLAVVNNAIENYCGRKFDPTTYTQTFYRDDIGQDSVSELFTFHYPVSLVTSATDENGEVYTDIRLRGEKGQLVLQESNRKQKWFFGYEKLTVVYDAGYTTMPPELQQVVYSIVAEAYNKQRNGIDVGFGNDVQRVSIAGVMSVDFDYTLQPNERSSAFGMIIGNWSNVLDFYRSERAINNGEIWENYVS